ncbi:polysaccharide deacetylase family protein [Streptomyces sp. ET3-23]|uniref:polysaccharide deacetylase family protein n=1 Tax=Streptomyces sp. ET3-23 TaxID=2885643 RepID=UPI001D0F7B30|nr:polysaccharide deacetylase family protein [Streptomyces sp. ET3-23]MCC2276917.1 polysaccharide deacetylase family protein [Streptomyces sp. ET3-23]
MNRIARALAIAVTLLGTATAPAASRPVASGPDCHTAIRRIPTADPVVALTFNAAWDEGGLAATLATLRQRAAPAIFFPTGRFAERHPAAVRAMAAAGHGLGSHSYSHPHFSTLSHLAIAKEVWRADAAIRRAGRTEPLPLFRFPYSETTPQAIAEVNTLGFTDVEFTTDTKGYLGTARGMTVDKVVERALVALTPGEIVQMHVGNTAGDGGHVLDAEALPRIIDAVRARGYRIVDLRTLAQRCTQGS